MLPNVTMYCIIHLLNWFRTFFLPLKQLLLYLAGVSTFTHCFIKTPSILANVHAQPLHTRDGVNDLFVLFPETGSFRCTSIAGVVTEGRTLTVLSPPVDQDMSDCLAKATHILASWDIIADEIWFIFPCHSDFNKGRKKGRIPTSPLSSTLKIKGYQQMKDLLQRKPNDWLIQQLTAENIHPRVSISTEVMSRLMYM